MTLRLFNNQRSPFDWELDDPFDNMLVNPRMSTNRNMTPMMTFDLVETEQDFKLLADLPGAQDLNVSIDKDIVTVQAERKHEHQNDSNKVHSFERSYGKTQRKFRVPEQADADKAEAKFVDGVLTIIFPKKTPVVANESRKLKIKRGGEGNSEKMLS